MVDICPNLGKRSFFGSNGCNWEVVYNTERPSTGFRSYLRSVANSHGILSEDILKHAIIKKTYVGHVCTQCGKMQNRAS